MDGNFRNIPCADCGKMMYGVHNARKRCWECSEAAKKIQQREYRKARAEQKKLNALPPPPKPVDHCKGCYYWQLVGGQRMCLYFQIEDRLRGCPPSEKCTKKTTKRQKMNKEN